MPRVQTVSHTQLTELLLIVGTVALISILPGVADAIAADSVLQAQQQDYAVQSRAPQSLGVLNANDQQNIPSQPSAPDRPMLVPVQAGGITYVTGGIGDDERDQLDGLKQDYNVHLLNSSTTGEYIVNTHVVLRNQQGAQLLDIFSGPILLMSLPAGNYTIDASNNGKDRTQQIKIAGTKTVALHFDWKVL